MPLLLVAASAWATQPLDAPPPAEPPLVGVEDLPASVAKVEGRVITRRELVRELVGSAAPQALDRLVRKMLVEQAAAAAGVTVTEEELNAQVKLDEVGLANEIRLAPWEVGDKNFAALIRARFRMSLEEYKHQVTRQKLLARKMLGRDLRPTEPQLQKFYSENDDLFQPQTRYRAAHILITPLSPRDLNLGGRLMSSAAYKEHLGAERKRKAQWLRERGVNLSDAPDVDTGPEWELSRQRALRCLDELRQGRISWERAVERYTQDPHDLPSVDAQGREVPPFRQRLRFPLQPGEVGWYDRNGPMVKEFYEGTKDLKAGQLSDLIRTPFGFHVVKMLEVAAAERKSYDQLRPQVERTYVDWVIRARSEKWMEDLVLGADLQSTRMLLWPPHPAIMSEGDGAADPVVARVNGQLLRRSEVWRELVRSDGPDALDRLINREAALGPLARLGPDLLEWLSRPATLRPPTPPAPAPITVSAEEIDLELSSDRLRLDRENEEARKSQRDAKSRSLDEFLYEQYGQTQAEYQRAISASLVLGKAVQHRSKVDEATLQLEFALAQDKYREPVAFEVKHILVAVPPGAGPEAQQNALAMARQMRQELLNGNKTWEELVALSQDDNSREVLGSLGRLGRDTKSWPELYAALVAGNFEKGQIPEPIRSRQGCHVVRIERRYAERLPEFSEVRGQVERDYLTAQGALYLDIWVRAMQRQAKIQRFAFQTDTLPPPDYFPLPEK